MTCKKHKNPHCQQTRLRDGEPYICNDEMVVMVPEPLCREHAEAEIKRLRELVGEREQIAA